MLSYRTCLRKGKVHDRRVFLFVLPENAFTLVNYAFKNINIKHFLFYRVGRAKTGGCGKTKFVHNFWIGLSDKIGQEVMIYRCRNSGHPKIIGK